MDQYVEDRLIIINSLEALSSQIRTLDDRKKWGQMTYQHYEGFRKHIKNELENWNRLQTVEELARLFESKRVNKLKQQILQALR